MQLLHKPLTASGEERLEMIYIVSCPGCAKLHKTKNELAAGSPTLRCNARRCAARLVVPRWALLRAEVEIERGPLPDLELPLSTAQLTKRVWVVAGTHERSPSEIWSTVQRGAGG